MKKTRYKNLRTAFGQRLREIRKSQNLTQATLAYMADIELSTLNRIELGKAGTSLTNIFALSAVLSVHPKELFEFPIN